MFTFSHMLNFPSLKYNVCIVGKKNILGETFRRLSPFTLLLTTSGRFWTKPAGEGLFPMFKALSTNISRLVGH